MNRRRDIADAFNDAGRGRTDLLRRREDLDSDGLSAYSSDAVKGWEVRAYVPLRGRIRTDLHLDGPFECLISDAWPSGEKGVTISNKESGASLYEPRNKGMHDAPSSPPSPDYGFWSGIIDTMVRGTEALTDRRTLSFDSGGWRLSLEMTPPRLSWSGTISAVAVLEVPLDRGVLWRFTVDGTMRDAPDGTPCVFRHGSCMLFHIPQWAQDRYGEENPRSEGTGWIAEHPWTGHPFGTEYMRGAVEEALLTGVSGTEVSAGFSDEVSRIGVSVRDSGGTADYEVCRNGSDFDPVLYAARLVPRKIGGDGDAWRVEIYLANGSRRSFEGRMVPPALRAIVLAVRMSGTRDPGANRVTELLEAMMLSERCVR